ncbi:alpha amylase C-terminal domain-containing protein [Bradyrhizobium sp. 177]|nr:alpha amylase C-terminal domain-containing protein [Bradyrhizobium sp. 177]
MIPVQFTYLTGIVGDAFSKVRARLHGSWDAAGRYSDQWSVADMTGQSLAQGSVSFRESIILDSTEHGKVFRWGVSFIFPDGSETWAIPTEVKDRGSRERYRSFQFTGQPHDEQYYLTHCTRLGANRVSHQDGSIRLRFAVWAPNAQTVEVVMGKIWDRSDPNQVPASCSIKADDIAGGYIADNGRDAHPNLGPFFMRQVSDGVWETNIDEPGLRNFKALDHKPYMYRVTRNDGSVAYRSDLYSRCQIGYGSFNPRGEPYSGLISGLDGTVSCSVVVDPEQVTKYFREEPPYSTQPPGLARVWPERHFTSDVEFWRDEFTDRRPPSRVEDLIIYELHTGALGFGSSRPGSLADAIALLDYLVDLGVNAVELLPLSEFGGRGENWGYSTSHYFAIEYSGGGRDQYKFFVKEAHKRGLAVIMDVVYNHFAHDAERAQWMYDAVWPDLNVYYWYESTPFAYQAPDGGFVDNMSTAPAPRYHEEMVRKLFISSAVSLVHEFHVDGLRVDQTTSIHSYNVLHADNRLTVPDANIFGGKLLRELGRTLRMIKPDVILIAEDHSTWDEVTTPIGDGGMGFDARWYAEFYHHLAGDTSKGADYAKLIYSASQRLNGEPLEMEFFARALSASGSRRVVYNESHDEAGNSAGPVLDPQWDSKDKDKKHTSHRSIVVAAGGAPLVGDTRRYAEARCRFAYGVTVLSAGTPMFLFGEEVGAEHRFKYDAVLQNREDLFALRNGAGANLFRFYADINRFRLGSPALRSRNIEVVYSSNDSRVLAFTRWRDGEMYLIVGTLNDRSFADGYVIPNWRSGGEWKEVFNSDSSLYGGSNIGNAGGVINGRNENLSLVLPSNSVMAFKRL